MRWYWTKIVVGALAIFGVGFGILSAARTARRQVVHVVEGSGDITVPVPFVPFVFGATEAGKLRRLVVHRTSPKQVSGFDVTVRVSDPAVLAQLAEGCRLTLKNAERIGNQADPFNTPFECASSDGDYRDFGSVTVQGRDESGEWVTQTTVPLVLPEGVIRELDGSNIPARVAGTQAARLRVLGDSLGQLGREMAHADQARRAELEAEMADLRSEMEDVSAAMAEQISKQVTEQVTRNLKVRVRTGPGASRAEATVEVPEPPQPPGN